jgi:hypothetical protein
MSTMEKAHQILADAAFSSDTLKILFKAFDDAWEQIAPSVSSRADAIEEARIRLAKIVLSLARNGSNDAEQIRDCATLLWSGDPD